MMEQKKKVLFVATVVKTHINTFHLPFLKMFKEYGWEVHVAAKNDFVDEPCVIPNCDRHFDIDFARSPFSKSNIKAYKQLKQIIETNHYDIIHCHTPVAGVLTRLAARTAKGTTVISWFSFLSRRSFDKLACLLSGRTSLWQIYR